MKKETLLSIEEFCTSFPINKLKLDNANDLRRITKVAYYAYKNQEDIEDIFNMITAKLKENRCVAFQEVAKECYDHIVDEKLIMFNLDTLELLK